MTTLESRLWDRLCQLTNDGATPLVKDQFLEMVREVFDAQDVNLAKTVEFRVAPGGCASIDDARHRKELMYAAIQEKNRREASKQSEQLLWPERFPEEYIARLHAMAKASST